MCYFQSTWEGKDMDQTQKLNAPIRKHIFLIVAGILLLLLAAAAGFDWQISQTIGNMNDPFATLFQDVGLWTAPLIIMLSCNVVCHYALRSSQLAWYIRGLMVIGSVIYAGWELWAGYHFNQRHQRRQANGNGQF